MTGQELARLMTDDRLRGALARHARRYSRDVQDQEEYIQDAFIRIGKLEPGKTLEYYEDEGRKAIVAAYHRGYYPKRVCKKPAQNTNGTSRREDKKPRNAVDLGDGRYINRKHETLDSWYYPGEWHDWFQVKGESHWRPANSIGKEDKGRAIQQNDSAKWKHHHVAVTKLSQVKTERDWEEYEHRQAMKTHEQLRAESGIGPDAYTLPGSEPEE